MNIRIVWDGAVPVLRLKCNDKLYQRHNQPPFDGYLAMNYGVDRV